VLEGIPPWEDAYQTAYLYLGTGAGVLIGTYTVTGVKLFSRCNEQSHAIDVT